MHKPNLIPYYNKKLCELVYGSAVKQAEVKLHPGGLIKKLNKTRFFELRIIATDEKGVWFEGSNYESCHRSQDGKYSGVVYIDLTEVKSPRDAQHLACELLPLGAVDH